MLFHPHLRGGEPGDKHSRKKVPKGLPGYEPRPTTIVEESGPCSPPVAYGFRSFDRQWIVPDNRVINQPNPELWESYSEKQVHLTAPTDRSPSAGPAITFSAAIPDLHHYNGRGGRVFPLWRDRDATEPNIGRKLVRFLSEKYGRKVAGPDVMAYIAAIVAHPAYTARFREDLVQPGLHVPLTADGELFAEAADLGRRVIWLHTFGERFVDPRQGRPAQLPRENAPKIPKAGAVPSSSMPDSIDYDATKRRLLIGEGYVEGVSPEVWNYEVSGKQVLRQWFSYRRKNRERPIIGDRRPPSKLGEIQPDHWLPEYTTELLNVLNVLGRLVELEPAQANLLERICSGPTITIDELRAAEALHVPSAPKRGGKAKVAKGQKSLLE